MKSKIYKMDNLLAIFTPGDKYLEHGIFFDVNNQIFNLYADTDLQVSISVNDPTILQQILRCWVFTTFITKGTHVNENNVIDYSVLEQTVNRFLSIDNPRLNVQYNQLLVSSNSCSCIQLETYLDISLKYFNFLFK